MFYLCVRDGEAVDGLGVVVQLDLLDHVGFRAQNHGPLQPALRWRETRHKRVTVRSESQSEKSHRQKQAIVEK